jgi:hypothetical protein
VCSAACCAEAEEGLARASDEADEGSRVGGSGLRRKQLQAIVMRCLAVVVAVPGEGTWVGLSPKQLHSADILLATDGCDVLICVCVEAAGCSQQWTARLYAYWPTFLTLTYDVRVFAFRC